MSKLISISLWPDHVVKLSNLTACGQRHYNKANGQVDIKVKALKMKSNDQLLYMKGFVNRSVNYRITLRPQAQGIVVHEIE